jgi:Zinc-finger associated domain (zf-AD)
MKNMENICRLCSCYSPVLLPVFSFASNDRLIIDMIVLICPVRIDPCDKYPQSICKSCLKTIQSAIELRNKSVESDIKFKSEAAVGQLELPTVETVRIKQEGDPFITLMDIEDESCSQVCESSDDASENSDNSNVTPYEPRKSAGPKKAKYKRTADGKFRCPVSQCIKAFTLPTNVRRHLKMEHGAKKKKKDGDDNEVEEDKEEQDKSTTCHICGQYISHVQNLKRHVLKMHPG